VGKVQRPTSNNHTQHPTLNTQHHFMKLAHVLVVALMLNTLETFSQQKFLEKKMHHLRSGDRPEWNGFPGQPEKQLEIKFKSTSNTAERTLKLVQQDVRYRWKVSINGVEIGRLNDDEAKMNSYLAIPPNTLINGKNTLLISPVDTVPDDISVGEISLFSVPSQPLLTQSGFDVSVFDAETNALVPAKITIVEAKQTLQQVRVDSNDNLAVRTGCIYTGNGYASFSVPGGKYIVYASRGTEYGIDSFKVTLKNGQRLMRKLIITREVPTDGWVAADTHVHTYTYSRHGDATIRERAITLAAEGIEFPVITDHNQAIDIDSIATALDVRKWFTPVVGDEYTTSVGHFNLFPLSSNQKLPDPKVLDWNMASQNLDSIGAGKAIVLNHARDDHNNFRPFDPSHHVAIAGTENNNWKFPANAMEVMNSGSQQNDIMQLFNDWFGMMNGGKILTPVGSSDSHDVSRYIVGQGRTYIRSNDRDPANIDIESTTTSFLAGRVMVSFGLMSEINVGDRFGAGDLAPATSEVNLSIRVYGPGWLRADKISLFANGQKIHEEPIEKGDGKGLKWTGTWRVPLGKQDVYFVAIAEGPGYSLPYWRIPNPYQPTSPQWNPSVIGASGALWIDADNDGKKTTAHDYAAHLIDSVGTDVGKIIEALSAYDESVSIQAAAILREKQIRVDDNDPNLLKAAPAVKDGFHAFNRSYDQLDAKLKVKS
jgi:hypothetical protein